MAKKRRRRRASLLTKAINVGVLLLGLSRPLAILMGPGEIGQKMTRITNEVTFNMAGGGSFDTKIGMRVYAPLVGAIILKKAISMLRKTARV